MNDDLRFMYVVDEASVLDKGFEAAVETAIDNGVTIIQLREKQKSTRAYIESAKLLRRLTLKHRVPFLVNDRVDVALVVKADGVHLGQSDMTYSDARNILGPGAMIGLTVENMSEALAAQNDDLDYLGLSAIFPTETKLDVTYQWTAEQIQLLKQMTRHPLIGIGGIRIDNVTQAMAMGLDGIAVVSAISSSKTLSDVGTITEKLSRLMDY